MNDQNLKKKINGLICVWVFDGPRKWTYFSDD